MPKNKKLMVVYFDPDHNIASTDFECFYKSWKFSGCNETTDILVVTTNPILSIRGKKIPIPEDCRIAKIDIPPYVLEPSFHHNKYMNSIGCFFEEEVIDIIQDYTHVVKSDIDIFLFPEFKDWLPEEFLCGRGAYSNSQKVRDNCHRIAELLGYQHHGHYNLGSTFIGKPDDILAIADKTWKAATHILRNEFPDGEGAWPDWYSGVTSMYASEIGVNDTIVNPTMTNYLDYPSSNFATPISEAKHVHCWHTDEQFSKFWYYNQKYKELSAGDFDPAKNIREYCMHVALTKSWFEE